VSESPRLFSRGAGEAAADLELQAAGAAALLAMPFAGRDGRQVVLALWL
jgi:hypothetical protein